MPKIYSEKNRTIQNEKKALLQILDQRYQRLMREIKEKEENPHLSPINFNSGFFGFFNVKNISAAFLAERLLKNGLGLVPAENPDRGINGIRIAFCSIPEEKISSAIDLIWRISLELNN